LEIDLLGEEGVDATFDLIEAGPAAAAFAPGLGAFAGAGLAADGTVSLVVQGVVGDFVEFEIVPDFVSRPIRHGIELDDVAAGGFIEDVEFDDPDTDAALALLSTEAGDPAIEFSQFALQREDLPDRAAEVGVAGPELGTLGFLLSFERDVGLDRVNGDLEEIFQSFLEVKGFRKEQPCIEGEDGEGKGVLPGEMDHDEACALEAGSDGRSFAEAVPGPLEDFSRGGLVETPVEWAEFGLGEDGVAGGGAHGNGRGATETGAPR